MRISPYFAWYDLWIGAYWDRAKSILYIGIPMVGIKIDFRPECFGARFGPVVSCTWKCKYYTSCIEKGAEPR
jgi:hypothetical protein